MATDLGTIRYKIEADVDQLDEATEATDRYRGESDNARKSNEGLNQSFRGLKTAISIAAVALGGLSFGRIIRESADFEASMLGVLAVSRANAQQFEQLTNQARTLGATTQFTAQQAAEAQRFLAQAGFDVNEILTATPGVLKLATAANLDLASSADIASNVLSGFRLPVQQLDRVMDVLANTAASANTDVAQLGQALSFAAPIATAAGLSIEETSAAIGALSDAGLQASRAGTGLVGVVRQLSRVTPEAERALATYGLTLADVDITTRGFQDVIDTLGEANISVADSFTIFGSEAGAAAQILTGTAARVEELTESNRNATGVADEMSEIMGRGLRASIRSLNSAVSESILQMGDSSSGLGGAMGLVIQQATGIISVYNGMLPEFARANDLTQQQTQYLTATAIALQSVAAGAATIGGLAIALRGATAAQVAFNIAARANPFALLAAGAVALVTALIKVRQANEDLVDVFTQAAESSQAYEAAQDRLPALEREINQIMQDRQKIQEQIALVRESDDPETQARKRFLSESQLAQIEEDRSNRLAALLAEENALRERYDALTIARRNADAAEMRRLDEEEEAAAKAKLDNEKAIADERARLKAERARAEAELQAMTEARIAAEQEAQRRGLESLRSSLDARYAADLKYKQDTMQVQEARATGLIESDEEMYALLLALGERHKAQLVALARDTAAEREQARIDAERKAMQVRATEIASAATMTADPEIARIQAQIDFLTEARREGLEIEGSYADAIVALEKKKAKRVRAIDQQTEDMRRMRQEQSLQATQGFFGNMATVAAAGGRESFEAYKALSMAEAGIAGTLAFMKALAAAPPPFNFALAGSVAAVTAVQMAQISGMEYKGARAMGGQVQPGEQYLVGERGPEILSMGGSPGHITPNHKLEGAGGEISVTNVFQLSTGVEQTVQSELAAMLPMITQMTKQSVQQAISNGGSMSRSVGRRS